MRDLQYQINRAVFPCPAIPCLIPAGFISVIITHIIARDIICIS